MMFKKIKLVKIRGFLKKIPRILVEHFFLTFLFLFFLSSILGSLIFYQSIILVQKEKPEIKEKPIQFKENLYQKILEVWQEKEKKFQEADLKKYPNPFKVG